MTKQSDLQDAQVPAPAPELPQFIRGEVELAIAEEFATSENPRRRDGGTACIDCLMQGECISKVPVQGKEQP